MPWALSARSCSAIPSAARRRSGLPRRSLDRVRGLVLVDPGGLDPHGRDLSAGGRAHGAILRGGGPGSALVPRCVCGVLSPRASPRGRERRAQADCRDAPVKWRPFLPRHGVASLAPRRTCVALPRGSVVLCFLRGRRATGSFNIRAVARPFLRFPDARRRALPGRPCGLP